MIVERKLGCIPNSIQASIAKQAGVKSDTDKLNTLIAPWDATDQPSVTDWNSVVEYLDKTGYDIDLYEDKYGVKQFYDIGRGLGLDIDNLYGTTQQQNDCAAWATTRCYLTRLLNQQRFGSERKIETMNPMALYAFSADAFDAGDRIPNGGRTLASVAYASCESGLLPSSLAGDYNGTCRVTSGMASNTESAKLRQCGWVELSFTDEDEIIKAVQICLKAKRPILMGNTTKIQDSCEVDSNGVYVSTVRGGWGGGHATAILAIQQAGRDYYYLIGNSHGKIYGSENGKPAWCAWITEDGLKRYIDGQFLDMYACTWAESVVGTERKELAL